MNGPQTRESLANEIWRACDILRRDNNCGGVMEYIEHLAWLLFLRFLDAQEEEWETQANLVGRPYTRILDSDLRWGAWATKDWPADRLLEFVQGRLIPYLQSLGGDPLRETIRSVFAERNVIVCASGYNLKDVLTIINGIDFHSQDDIFTVSQVYEELLRRLGSEPAGWRVLHAETGGALYGGARRPQDRRDRLRPCLWHLWFPGSGLPLHDKIRAYPGRPQDPAGKNLLWPGEEAFAGPPGSHEHGASRRDRPPRVAAQYPRGEYPQRHRALRCGAHQSPIRGHRRPAHSGQLPGAGHGYRAPLPPAHHEEAQAPGRRPLRDGRARRDALSGRRLRRRQA